MRPDARSRDGLGESGGALVELALASMVFVSLALYAALFSDLLHQGIKTQEATLIPAWSATASQVHDFRHLVGENPALVRSVASSVARQSEEMLGTSFDSTRPGGPNREAFVGLAQRLRVDCIPSRGTGSAPGPADAVHSAVGLPVLTWITCSAHAEVSLHTPLGHLFPWAQIPVAGVGPGPTGTWALPEPGFAIVTDDWAVEDGQPNGLETNHNQAYYRVGARFFGPGASPAPAVAMVTGQGDLGGTGLYRLSYRVAPDGSYTVGESEAGQDSPHGGPAAPHTGGPWHEEGTSPPNLSQTIFQMRARANVQRDDAVLR